MDDGIFLKEYATADFTVRKFGRFRYDPEVMVWRPVEAVAGASAMRPFTYLSLYSWQTDPAQELQTPVIHYIIFDFDSQLADIAQNDAVNFVRYLEAIHDVNPGCLGLYFSGSKGFHVQLPIGVLTQGEALWGVTPAVIRDFALRLTEGFKTADPYVYDARRLFRVPNAINVNSGLRKIPLTWKELQTLHLDEIRALAAERRSFVRADEPSVSSSLYELILTQSETSREASVRRPVANLQEIFRQAEPGQRNVRATQLAGLLVKAMDDLPLTREVVRLWNRTNAHPLMERELDNIITGVYERYHNRHKQARRPYVVGF